MVDREVNTTENSGELLARYLSNVDIDVLDVPTDFDIKDILVIAKRFSTCIVDVERDAKMIPFELNEPRAESVSSKSSSGVYTPNDELFSSHQWYLHNSESGGIRLDKAWNDFRGPWNDSGPLVGVIDTGFTEHEDFPTKWKNPGEVCGNNLDDDGNGLVDDCHGYDFGDDKGDPMTEPTMHGSPVAGALAAKVDNSVGIAGACYHCQVMLLKVAKGSEGFYLSAVISAIEYLIKMKVRISNHSYGLPGWHNAEYQAFKQLLETDHVAFVAAGNSACDVDANSPNGVTSETCGQKGDQNSCCWTPGAYPLTGIINVGASTRTGAPAQFSCWGKFSVDVFGPGTDGIASLVTSGGRDSYAYVHGTSFAAPLVAGAVAYVWSSNPEATRDQVIAAVVSGVHKLPQLKDKATTEGIFDAFETLTAFKTILGSQQTKPASGAAGSSMAASTFCALLGATVSTILAGW
eukprot:GHVU01124908.1.p1 GENE.GHVU01124908.1~~GHVU01124908.1.p1  ORF type:complete len:542 (-),score=54.77 GHVU01124908.1:858-2246(-)